MTEKPPLHGVLVLSYFFPPMSNGPAFVADALFSELDLAGSVMFTGMPDRYSPFRECGADVSAQIRRFDIPRWWPREDGVLRLRSFGNVLVALRVAVAAARVLRRGDIRGLLVVYPKQHFLLAGCLASLTTQKPFTVYFMDTYVQGLPRGRAIARMIERLVARRATLVFGMSEPHRDELSVRLGIQRVVVLPHPYVEERERAAEPDLAGVPSILFTGAVYDAQADALRRLVAALDELNDLDPRLYIYSQTDPVELASFGIVDGGRVRVRRGSRAESRAAQRVADVLFLPISFDARREVRATASPSKMPEYLAAGRPIVVHGPPDSYLVRYACERGFAYIVDEPDTAALARAVRAAHRWGPLAGMKETLARHRSAKVAEIFRQSLEDALA